jgi:hypothetical protein
MNGWFCAFGKSPSPLRTMDMASRTRTRRSRSRTGSEDAPWESCAAEPRRALTAQGSLCSR